MTVTFEKSMNLAVTKEVFLSNKENKQRFIIMLGEELSKKGCTVFHDTGDANCLIVKKAMESAAENNVVLVGDDTDLLILLLHQQYEGKHDVFFAPEPKKNSKARFWDVKDVKESLGSFICKHILFIHAMLGCDSTSRVFGLGKGVLLKKIRSNLHLQQYANVFSSRQSTNEDVQKAGEQTMVILYGGKKDDDLNFLRHKKFCEKVASNVASIEPQTLPPTSAAMKLSSLLSNLCLERVGQ